MVYEHLYKGTPKGDHKINCDYKYIGQSTASFKVTMLRNEDYETSWK